MHEESVAPGRPTTYANEALIAHVLAFLGALFSAGAVVVFRNAPDIQPELSGFGATIFFVCAGWSGTLAVRSIWCREGATSAWILFAACLLEINVPLIWCYPVVFSAEDAPQWTVAVVESGVPLFVPLISLIEIVSVLITRWRLRVREKGGRSHSSRECVQLGFFWTGISSIPMLLALPVLLFLYSLAPVRSNYPNKLPSGLRGAVLEWSPTLMTDCIAQGFDCFKMQAGLRGALRVMECNGLLSSRYLLNVIEYKKGIASDDVSYAFSGLNRKYPDIALQLAHSIWSEPFIPTRCRRFMSAAWILARKTDAKEFRELLLKKPQKNDCRRAYLMYQLSGLKRFDVEYDVYGIAIDTTAPDRLFAINALSEFSSPVVTVPLWFDFLETSTPEQIFAIGYGITIPKAYQLKFYMRALEDKRPRCLRCWISNIVGLKADYIENLPLILRLLELSDHPDLSIRRSALKAIGEMLYPVFKSNLLNKIPQPWDEKDFYYAWWPDPAYAESQLEIEAAAEIRKTLRDLIGRKL